MVDVKTLDVLVEIQCEVIEIVEWCPEPGCDCAIEFDLGSDSYDVSCYCSYSFCWNSMQKSRRGFASNAKYYSCEAEAGLERLHQCAENELRINLNQDASRDEFNNFRNKLAGLASVTHNYFENLVRALENGLSDVKACGACSNAKPIR